MKPGLQPGQIGRLAWRVGPQQTIHLGAESGGGAVVFSTPAMINMMEHAAREALRPYLEPGEESVGVTVEVQHLAATPIAAEVRAEAKVTAVDGKLIDFTIAAFDAAEAIGRGTHRRAVIRVDRMRDRLAEKAATLPNGVLLPMHIEPNTGQLPDLPTLAVAVEGAVATVTLNRPDKLNAVNVQMTGDLERLVAWLAGHPEVRVVIVTGAGRAFCAGDDVKEVGTLDPDTATTLSLRQARAYLAFEQLPQVIIAAVNGACFGGGCVAAYSCDLRIASLNADFGMPEILLGWPPGYGVAQLTALVGKARALELCVTGKTINARTALDWGLVNEVVPPQQLMPAARKLADTLLATPPIALRETKRLIHDDEGVQPKITHLADTAAYIDCLKTADAREGIAAFVEKRGAKFTGR
ncbi:MAG: hypothetical protein GC159_18350 [Phycisphaera sp.]|nr:hypothetical protein [Phycisphaera sp.]